MKNKKEVSYLEKLSGKANWLADSITEYAEDLACEISEMPDGPEKDRQEVVVRNLYDAMNDAQAVNSALYLALHPEDELV